MVLNLNIAIGIIMDKEQVQYIIKLLREGHSLTKITKLAKINIMYVSVIRKLMVMDLLRVEV
ncbi:hypothetical protein PE36_20035 [Moritella sp. PE36]|nr:hypothetical protein PE36_20035 [Moritella sp. PE36]